MTKVFVSRVCVNEKIRQLKKGRDYGVGEVVRVKKESGLDSLAETEEAVKMAREWAEWESPMIRMPR